MDVLEKIRWYMKKNHWSKYQLAKHSNISQSTITGLFKRNNAPTIPTLEAICAGFGITVSEFFDEGTPKQYLTPGQMDMLRCFGELSENQQELVMKLIQELAKPLPPKDDMQ